MWRRLRWEEETPSAPARCVQHVRASHERDAAVVIIKVIVIITIAALNVIIIDRRRGRRHVGFSAFCCHSKTLWVKGGDVHCNSGATIPICMRIRLATRRGSVKTSGAQLSRIRLSDYARSFPSNIR
eukprot:GHVU01157233.1.p1 GENE.GHVU01157233.1~~GHVU01157233.1.p1  ORF type:complete len:127 (+),score=17.19 GHVU01157233.1:72-452(+)